MSPSPRPRLARTPRRALARVATIAAAGLALTVLGVLPASAHITVAAPGATAGDEAVLNFRVPTEKDNASTTTVQVTMPANQPLASVAVQPHPGWTAVVQKTTLPQPIQTDDGPVTQVVTEVTWTATTPQAAIAPGQFDEFSLLAGPLPNAASLSFPATQTYSDGSVVAWNQAAAPGAPEPEHPAPTLTLTSGADTSPAPAANSAATGSSPSSTPLVLSIVALVVAVAALAGLAVALLRGRRRSD